MTIRRVRLPFVIDDLDLDYLDEAVLQPKMIKIIPKHRQLLLGHAAAKRDDYAVPQWHCRGGREIGGRQRGLRRLRLGCKGGRDLWLLCGRRIQGVWRLWEGGSAGAFLSQRDYLARSLCRRSLIALHLQERIEFLP